MIPLRRLRERSLEVLKAEIRERLQRVCEHFSSEDFETLVDDVARIRLKYDVEDPEL